MKIHQRINDIMDREQRPLKSSEIQGFLDTDGYKRVSPSTLGVTLWRLVEDGRLTMTLKQLRCPNFYYKPTWGDIDIMAQFDSLARHYVKHPDYAQSKNL